MKQAHKSTKQPARSAKARPGVGQRAGQTPSGESPRLGNQAVGVDPIFALIEQHRLALADEDRALQKTVRTLNPAPEDEEAVGEAHNAVDDAYDEMMATVPTTSAGTAALLEHLAAEATRQGFGFEIDSDRFAALLRPPRRRSAHKLGRHRILPPIKPAGHVRRALFHTPTINHATRLLDR